MVPEVGEAATLVDALPQPWGPAGAMLLPLPRLIKHRPRTIPCKQRIPGQAGVLHLTPPYSKQHHHDQQHQAPTARGSKLERLLRHLRPTRLGQRTDATTTRSSDCVARWPRLWHEQRLELVVAMLPLLLEVPGAMSLALQRLLQHPVQPTRPTSA